jgi:hypothetical protein
VKGVLPASRDFALGSTRRGVQTFGKAIVFARHDVTVGDTHSWWPVVSGQWPGADGRPDHRSPIADRWIRDVPHPGERIAAGRPVCTVLAGGRDALDCHAALVDRAERVYADLATPSLRVRRA